MQIRSLEENGSVVVKNLWSLNNMKLDIKTLITLLTIAATLGGFYYTTQTRLGNLEQEVSQLEKQIKRLARKVK